jgi:hypothetical protein
MMISGCICGQLGRDDDARGRCSAIPPCCRQFFIDVWSDIKLPKRSERRLAALRWDYIPCPGCRHCGARVRIRRCEDRQWYDDQQWYEQP